MEKRSKQPKSRRTDKIASTRKATIKTVRSAGKVKLANFIKPMLATLHNTAFDDPSWLFELKWDGYRAIAEVSEDVKLYSRNGLSFLSLYPSLGNALKNLKHDVILDGEIVVLNKETNQIFRSFNSMLNTIPH